MFKEREKKLWSDDDVNTCPNGTDGRTDGQTKAIRNVALRRPIQQAVREAARYPPAPVRRTLQPSSSPYTPYACGAQRALRHEYSVSTGSGWLWLWLWCRPYKVCSDLNSQPKRPGDLGLWPFDLESGILVTCDVGYLYVNFSLPRPLCSRVRPDVRDRRQTSDKSID